MRLYLTGAVVQSLSYVWLFVTPWTTTRQAPLSLVISWSLLKLMSIESVMPLSYLIVLFAFFLLFAYYYTWTIWNKHGYSS